MISTCGRPPRLLLTLIAALLGAAGTTIRAQEGRTRFPDSIRPVPTAPGNGAYVVRNALSAGEEATPMTFSVSLQMRDFAGLQARLATGERISRSEMEAKYLPLQSDYDRVVAWLESQGLTIVFLDSNHTTIGVQGTVAQIAQALDVSFARVAVPGTGGAAATEVTSAVTAPSLPSGIAGPVLGINRLQPHLRFHHVPITPITLPRGQDVVSGNAYITPDDLAAAYTMSSTWTGKGQMIAIVDEASVPTSDLSAFWTAVGSSQTAGNVAVEDVDGGPSGGSDAEAETALDVEWAGALAPGAQIRLYLAPDAVSETLLAQILSDQESSYPTMNVVSISYGLTESESGSLSEIQGISHEIALMAAAGMTVLAASGDAGSNPSNATGDYSAKSALSVEYPASDPDATGVGGTSMAFNSSWADTGEVVWNQLSSNPPLASGGGLSVDFSAPSWQTGTPSSTARCVPDVAAAAAGTSGSNTLGALIVVNSDEAVVGTSLACPTWAAVVAQINQARTTAGVSSIGLLGPRIYPLVGTSSFTDITSGNNGAYSAGVGYDLCTGLGTPNVTNLIAALVGPVITAQPQSTTTTVGGSFTFSVTATGTAPLSYQWYLGGAAVSGQTSATYYNGNATASDGGSYTVVVANAAGSVTSTAATLTVNGGTAAAGGGSSGGGGGGGAPSLWFYGALAALAGARLALRLRRAAVKSG